eukprot:TRINITY_DN3569_c0_g3_i1.p1 TRINITY_DN3569_c0_g3~~TRINITY_DN3569_c0_g3_i1.p1  ORF type:complete len:103 (-),score=19.37 TRINITY_DN3569_c0_g3_i1:154-462(-)
MDVIDEVGSSGINAEYGRNKTTNYHPRVWGQHELEGVTHPCTTSSTHRKGRASHSVRAHPTGENHGFVCLSSPGRLLASDDNYPMILLQKRCRKRMRSISKL